ncbi:MAG: SDR family NAD(P)-dependent oxidoreductase [Runella slithyformis]|nr:MAG: SDR family NAD(P)-dependent oxidoreductase [Runella slithyformis]TAE90278.1 MAG: SDR family NAD(P)-dependent oxidoreductase [Runella slithyformis]TAF28855.1 MAG: SDR family NAD(P)-dependent oxidoreductase [Runella slithyformis]TAF48972.1 MAG: SDR family NAD(P)-dependent oxidoreductase [Runella slithyformis]TAF83533.1 MAG: SDR family NAD(P)-dependent oxidoreductase [Runella slithyformis]
MKISILGCGWLGLPLAQQLVKNGHVVRGSTTTLAKLASLRQVGVQPFCLNLNPEPMGVGWDFFLETEVLIINIPPRLERAGSDFHPAQMRALVHLLANSPVRQLVYVSSTSVYPELNREMVETDVATPAQSAVPALVVAEQLLQNTGIPTLVLRCGGLMGYERIPGKYVSGKQNLDTGDIPVNYVHRDDVIAAIIHLLSSETPQTETYNVVAPAHPARRLVYEATCLPFGYTTPTFAQAPVAHSFKTVSSHKLMAHTHFCFKYPNPLLFSYVSV